MAASFPGSVKSFGAERVNGEYIPANDTNDLRAEVVAVETALLNGGWLGVADLWSYASVNSFAITGDRTGVYTKGLRIRWTQSSIKYGVVVQSVYSAPNTLVTIAVNTDYTLVNATISGQAISNLLEPRGFPGWFNWSMVVTAGSGAITAYTVNLARYRLTAGEFRFITDVTITTNGTGATSVLESVPVTLITAGAAAGRETAAGKMLQVEYTAAALVLRNYDNSYPAVSGSRLVCGGMAAW